MKLGDIFEAQFIVKKTIWSKRGDKITRRDVDASDKPDIQPRTKIEITDVSRD